MLVNPGMVLISFKMISSGPRTKKSTLAIPAASMARNAVTALRWISAVSSPDSFAGISRSAPSPLYFPRYS